MSSGKERHPKRKGGRYTPPRQRHSPEQGMMQQPILDFISSRNASVDVPHSYRRYVPGVEQMPIQDLVFIDGLQRKFGIWRDYGKPQRSAVKLEEPEFFSAVSDLKTYVLDLRSRIDGPLPEMPPHKPLDEMYILFESLKPSNKRITNLCTLFLNLPPVKRTFMDIHARKMVRAFPAFSANLAADIPNPNNLAVYFSDVENIMIARMRESLEEDKYKQIDNLALINGYQFLGLRIPERDYRTFFAGLGVPTFTGELERVVRGAIDDGVDVAERVREEFLDTEGTIYKLMRVPLRVVGQLQHEVRGKSMPEARRILAEDYGSGLCPAALPTDSADNDNTQRPIAYEYAVTILGHIPPELLKPAA